MATTITPLARAKQELTQGGAVPLHQPAPGKVAAPAPADIDHHGDAIAFAVWGICFVAMVGLAIYDWLAAFLGH